MFQLFNLKTPKFIFLGFVYFFINQSSSYACSQTPFFVDFSNADSLKIVTNLYAPLVILSEKETLTFQEAKTREQVDISNYFRIEKDVDVAKKLSEKKFSPRPLWTNFMNNKNSIWITPTPKEISAEDFLKKGPVIFTFMTKSGSEKRFMIEVSQRTVTEKGKCRFNPEIRPWD
jgi:hypothetical protein